MSPSPTSTCAIIVSSCDAYSDAWEPFFTLFFRYWPDCPFPIYLISTGKVYPDKRVTTIPIAPDEGWASNMRLAIAAAGHPSHILYLQEDYFLKRSVSSDCIRSLLTTLENEHGACLMLYPAPGPNTPFKHYRDIGLIRPGTPYRVSLQAGLWDASVFERLLVSGETGAAMEHSGSVRSDTFTEPFLSVARGALFPYDKSAAFDYFSTGIIKGRWHGGVRRFFAQQHIQADLSRRPVESAATARRNFLKSLPLIGTLARLVFRVEYKLKTVLQRQ